MQTIKIAIAGTSGRMGTELIKAIANHPKLKLSAAIERVGSDLIDKDAGLCCNTTANNIIVSDNLANTDFDILIDFTRPEASLKYIEQCVKMNKKIILGTTGFSDSEKEIIHTAAQKIAIVFAANFSVGVNLVLKLVEKAALVMQGADIEIIEAHHRHKIDAPSGTALAIGESIAAALGRDLNKDGVFCRHGNTGERENNQIGFSTIRAADVVGEHSAWFADIGERVEISHKATSRQTFANGALRAAQFLATKNNGLFSMTEVLGLDKL